MVFIPEGSFILPKYIFPIAHLQNISSYGINYGKTPPALSEIQIQCDNITKPHFYHFSDYIAMLLERVKHIYQIVKDHHNEVIDKCHL